MKTHVKIRWTIKLLLAAVVSSFAMSHSLQAQGTATRTMPATYTPGVPFTVTITTNPPATAVAQGAEDHLPNLPAGWTVANPNNGGKVSTDTDGFPQVKWVLLAGGSQTLTYTVTPPSTATTTQTFSGIANYGDPDDVTIGGASSISKASTPTVTPTPTATPTPTPTPAGTATRTMPATYTPGVPFMVTITTNPPAFSVAQGAEDHLPNLPAGWTVENPNNGGKVSTDTDGFPQVKWVLLAGGPQTLTYTVTPPSTATTTQTFSGIANYGEPGDVTIGGASSISKAATPTVTPTATPTTPPTATPTTPPTATPTTPPTATPTTPPTETPTVTPTTTPTATPTITPTTTPTITPTVTPTVTSTVTPTPTSVADTGRIFVTNGLANSVSEHDVASGGIVKAPFVSGLSNPYGIAVAGPNLLVTNTGNGTVSAYNLASGQVVNASFISGLNAPRGIISSGSDIFVANYGAGTVAKYNSAGGLVDASFISGLSGPSALAVSGGSILVASSNGTIGKYNAQTGVGNPAIISGLNNPVGLAVFGENLFVATTGAANGVAQYGTTGALKNAAFITSVNAPSAITVYGEVLFVAYANGTIGEYDAATGQAANATLISGLSAPYGIVVVPTASVVEPTPTPVSGQKPVVVLTGKKKVVTTKAKLVLKGITTGDVTSVTYLVGKKKSPVKKAVGTTAWKITVKKLLPGKNIVTIIAHGPSGDSAPVKVTITRKAAVPVAPAARPGKPTAMRPVWRGPGVSAIGAARAKVARAAACS